MSQRIVVLGANGQVAAEVCLILAGLGADVVPVCRGAMGASFLRYMGLPVRLGSIDRPEDAPSLIGDADLVANFALAGGPPAEMRRQHDRIITHCFDHSPKRAQIVFFSTLAVNPGFNETGAGMTSYGREKLRNEALVERLAKRRGRDAVSFRLGHVCGELQGITQYLREAVRDGPVAVADPERQSNAVATATICDAILKVASGEASRNGLFGLVNVPGWTWRELLEYEAERAEVPLQIEQAPAAPPRAGGLKSVARRVAGAAFGSPLLKRNADRLLSRMSEDTNMRIAARYRVRQAGLDVAGLHAKGAARIDASFIAAVEERRVRGLAPTAELLADPRYVAPTRPIAPPWPPNLPAADPSAAQPRV